MKMLKQTIQKQNQNKGVINNKTANNIIFELKLLQYLQNKNEIIYINEIKALEEDVARLRKDIITKQIIWYWEKYENGYNIVTFD